MHKKILSLALAATFMFVAFSGVLASDSDADTTTSSGTYSIYAYDGQQWKSQIVSSGVYDAAEALLAANTIYSSTDSVVAKYEPATVDYPYVTYNATTYGNINTLMGKTSTSANYWHVYVSTGTVLSAATVSLGNYTCFSDYDSNYQASNVVLYYGASTLTLSAVQSAWNAQRSANTVVSISEITTVSNDDAGFAVNFALIIDTGATATVLGSYTDNNDVAVTSDNLNSDFIYVTGYGSNAYLALKNVFSTTGDLNVELTIPINGYYYYTWMYNLFGLTTVQTGNYSWSYWSLYDLNDDAWSDGTDHVADFVMGAYSPMSSGIFNVTTFTLIYEDSSM